MGAKAHDVDLSHGGRKLAQKPGEEQERGRWASILVVAHLTSRN